MRRLRATPTEIVAELRAAAAERPALLDAVAELPKALAHDEAAGVLDAVLALLEDVRCVWRRLLWGRSGPRLHAARIWPKSPQRRSKPVRNWPDSGQFLSRLPQMCPSPGQTSPAMAYLRPGLGRGSRQWVRRASFGPISRPEHRPGFRTKLGAMPRRARRTHHSDARLFSGPRWAVPNLSHMMRSASTHTRAHGFRATFGLAPRFPNPALERHQSSWPRRHTTP